MVTDAEVGDLLAIQEPPKTPHFYIPSLDGIRAVAFLLVFVGHAGLGHIVPGGFGVTIFFFLSGYLITTLMRREAGRTGSVNLKNFYLRRALRILPPFYLVLAVAVTIMAAADPGEIRPQAIVAQMLQCSNYYMMIAGPFGIPPGMVVTWSLAVEEHFYLLFPLLYVVALSKMRLNAQAATLVALCGLVLAWRCFLVYGLGATEHRIYGASDTRVDSILFGCLLAVWRNPVLEPPTWTGRRKAWFDWVIIPMAVLGLVGSLAFRDPRFRETFRYSIQGVSLIPLFMAAIHYHRSLPFRFLNIGWVRFLGVISYSLYLIHFNVLLLLGSSPGRSKLVVGIASFVVSSALAVAIYYFVEKPCARIRRRLSRGE